MYDSVHTAGRPEEMTSEEESARSLARRLVARAAEAAAVRSDDVIAVHEACEDASVALARSLGATGFHALLTRGLSQAQATHHFLKDVRVRPAPEPSFGGVAELVEAHGSPAVAVALELTLERVLTLLVRLIGADVVSQLVEPRMPSRTRTDGER